MPQTWPVCGPTQVLVPSSSISLSLSTAESWDHWGGPGGWLSRGRRS